MNHTLMIAICGVFALVVSLALPIAVKPVLIRMGVMDVPNERSSHIKPVLRGLGLAVVLAVLLVAVFAVLIFPAITTSQQGWFFFVVVLGSLCSGALGLGEDLRGVSVLSRSISLLVIAGTTAWLLTWQGAQLTSSWLSDMPIWVLLLFVLYGVFFISSYINVANFMDGLNGISGFHGVIAGSTFLIAGVWCDLPWLACIGVILAAAFTGFLPWNLAKPGAFLGDVGSYFLGGSVAITSFAALAAGVPFLATIGPMIIYFGDVGVTLVKRVRAGYRWDEPHKEHAYQRLQQQGMGHVRASGVTASFTAAASALGLLSILLAPIWWILLLVIGVALVVIYVRLPRK